MIINGADERVSAGKPRVELRGFEGGEFWSRTDDMPSSRSCKLSTTAAKAGTLRKFLRNRAHGIVQVRRMSPGPFYDLDNGLRTSTQSTSGSHGTSILLQMTSRAAKVAKAYESSHGGS